MKKDSIKNNSHNSNIEDYISKIEHFDNPELIFFLDNIAKSDRKSLNVKWIALELNEEINFNMSKLFRDFIFLDFALDKQGVNGRIDIVEYENRAKMYLYHYQSVVPTWKEDGFLGFVSQGQTFEI